MAGDVPSSPSEKPGRTVPGGRRPAPPRVAPAVAIAIVAGAAGYWALSRRRERALDLRTSRRLAPAPIHPPRLG